VRRPLLVTLPLAALTAAVLLLALRAGDAPAPPSRYVPLTSAVAPAAPATSAATPRATPAAPVVSVQTLPVGGVARQWEQLVPAGGTAPTTPILVVLHGQAETAAQEVQRDALTPLVAAGTAELVYPQGIGNSWNAGGCCGPAWAQRVDDLDFIRDLVARVDPGRARPVYLVGYSNGGRLAYTVACNDPALVDGFAIVDAMPLSGCTLSRPITALQVDGTADPAVPYQPGDPGSELPPATTQVERLRVLDGCPAAPATVSSGTLTVDTWSGCDSGARLGFATYHGGTHLWPAGDAATPGAGPAIWQFLSGQPR
jgi:polyhydroxybutyrate depolymerase